MKKKFLTTLTLAFIALGLSGCGIAGEEKEQIELNVFAAASLTEALTQLEADYERENPDINIILTLDSSGTLKKQIEEGADCDIFIAASQKPMKELDNNFVDFGSSSTLLKNKVVLVVPKNNPKGVKSFEDMAAKLNEGEILLAMGNADVPVGEYTREIFDFYGLEEEELAKDGLITYGTNVKDISSKVQEGMVDCGVVYSTDAFSANLTIVDTATDKMCKEVIYPAARMKKSQNKEAAEAFLDFLSGEEAAKVFEEIGFAKV